MKIITYHYIKSFSKKYPYANFLDKKKFLKQLIFFEKKFGIIKNEDEIFKKITKFYLHLMMALKIIFMLQKF